jgi:hypothetical protein
MVMNLVRLPLICLDVLVVPEKWCYRMVCNDMKEWESLRCASGEWRFGEPCQVVDPTSTYGAFAAPHQLHFGKLLQVLGKPLCHALKLVGYSPKDGGHL